MPGKSRRKRKKYSSQSKKKGMPSYPTIVTQQSAVAQTRESVSSPKVPVPRTSVSTPRAKPATVQHPYIATELRTIGILAGILLIILVVLALVLS